MKAHRPARLIWFRRGRPFSGAKFLSGPLAPLALSRAPPPFPGGTSARRHINFIYANNGTCDNLRKPVPLILRRRKAPVINEGGMTHVAPSMDESLRKEAVEGRFSCAREDCGRRERLYSPPRDRRISRVLIQRIPYCMKCGVLRNISSDRAKLVGLYTNLLRIVNHNVALSSGKIARAQHG